MRRGHGNKRVFVKYFIFNARKNVLEVRLLNCTRILHTYDRHHGRIYGQPLIE